MVHTVKTDNSNSILLIAPLYTVMIMLALIYTNRAAHVIIPKADTAVTQSNRHYALAASSRDS